MAQFRVRLVETLFREVYVWVRAEDEGEARKNVHKALDVSDGHVTE